MRICFLFTFLIINTLTALSQEFKRSTEIFKNFLVVGQNGSYARVPVNTIWSNQADFTIEAIVRFNKPLNPTGGAIFVNTVGLSGSSDWGWGFVAIDNRFGFHVCSPQPTQNMANQTDTISACTWYHLAGVKQGNLIQFYLNGILKGTADFPNGQQVRTSTGPAQFGYHRPPFQNWFDGNIDEFRLWNFARTAAQIQAKMNDTLLGNEAGLQAYYKFNESGQGNGITLVNSAQVSGNQMNGTSVSSNSNFPRLTNTEVLPFPQPPLVPTQPAFWYPGSTFNLSVNPVTGSNVIRYNWYSSPATDTVKISGISGTTYQSPFLVQTDTFFVSSVNNLQCESPKVPVIATVFPKPPVPQISSFPNPSCFGQPIVLKANANNPINFSWFKGINGSNQISGEIADSLTLPTPNNGDTIWVAYKGGPGGCQSDKVYTILNVIPQLSSPNIIADPNPFCPQSNIQLSTQIPFNSRYFWFRGGQGNVFLDSTEVPGFIRINQEKKDTIWLFYKTKSGNCISPKGSVILTPTQKPDFNISSELVCPGRQSSFLVSGLGNWKVEMFEDSILSKSILETETNRSTLSPIIQDDKKYWFRLISTGSLCPSQILNHVFKVKVGSIGIGDSFCVQIPDPYIPNLISPNGDGHNDYFEIKNLDFFQPSDIQIYNRWGKKVFSESPYLNKWAGENGSYFYVLTQNSRRFVGYIQCERN